MTQDQREILMLALRHGHDDPELEEILARDVEAIEPIIDAWIAEAREDISKGRN